MDDCTHCWHVTAVSIGSDGNVNRSTSWEVCCLCGKTRRQESVWTITIRPSQAHGPYHPNPPVLYRQ